MTLEQIIIATARVAGSLPVLRWAFVGSILAILVDFSDLFMMNLINLGGVGNYQTFDKWVDQVYMLAFLWVAVRQWEGPGRTVAIWLFAFRIIGFRRVRVHRVTLDSDAFPRTSLSSGSWRSRRNVIGGPDYEFTRWRIVAILAGCTALKLAQEYILHVWQVLDNYTAVGVVTAWWEFLTGLF